MAKIRNKIADRGQTQARHRRTLRLIDHFMQTGIESTIHMYGAAVGDKSPRVALQRLRSLIHACAKCEHRIFLCFSKRAVFQRKFEVAIRRCSFDVGLPHDALHGGDGRLEGEPLRPSHVELPAEEYYREPLLQQKAIAQHPRLERQIPLLRAAHDGQRLVAAAVHDFEEHRSPSTRGIFRNEHQEIARKFDLALRVCWSRVDVGNRAICRQLRINREVHASDDSFVRADVIFPSYINPDDFC
ncbi:MAG: hypothetical protein DMG14_06405 [Acidobacteria bacterium]|nr:MAG: hypothetical protein DMG14_06405 [Acidobacteriota bacterium]